MELENCGSFVQSATAQFKRFAENTKGLNFTFLKAGFWIRDAGGRGVFQGNYTIDRLRPFMSNLQPSERARLRQPVRYKNRYQDGHRFYVENQSDIDVVKAIIAARCE
jgi:hypothetical protein